MPLTPRQLLHSCSSAAALLLAALLAASCAKQAPPPPAFVATIAPLGMIISELAGDHAPVHVLLQPGVSPHTYELQPADARAAESALALFYVDATLDGWAARLPAKAKLEVLPLVPEAYRKPYAELEHEHAGHDHGHSHAHGETDPHFWSDPLAVKALLPALVAAMTAHDPAGADTFQANLHRFADSLDALHARLEEETKVIHGRSVLLFHPSWNYFLERYGLKLAGLVEPAPGRERSPRGLKELLDVVKAEGVRAVFTEPQLPAAPAVALAQSANLPLFELDPNGGVAGRDTYESLLLHNAHVLMEALR